MAYLNKDGVNHLISKIYNAINEVTNTVSCIQIETDAETAEKVGTCTNYTLLAKSYAHANVINANTAQSALTLNVNGAGTKPIYINGTASSSSNYTLPAGTYIIYYDGTNYHFRTDGVLPGKISNATNSQYAHQIFTEGEIGSSTKPIYIDSNGYPTECGFTVETSVPSDAVFTDTYDPLLLDVTYDELKELRDSGNLIPGQQYRITDYITTTSQENTKSAGYQFDIIVTATSNNTLSEIANACNCNNDETYITKFWSETGWDESPRSFSYDGKYVLDGNVYCKYKTDGNFSGELLFDFNDKTKVYSDGEEIRFIPSYYRNEGFGYTDWILNDIMIVAGDEFCVPYISSIDVYNNEYPEIIESIKKQYDINYFRYAGANLSAWQIWYCLDNDVDRFEWADGYSYDSDNNLYEFNEWVTAVGKVYDEQIDTFYETGINEKFSHFGYSENLDGVLTLTLYGRNLDGDIDEGLDMRQLYHYKGVYNVDGKEYDGWAQLVLSDDGGGNYASHGEGGNIYILTERIVVNYGNRDVIKSGKGVIYRMIDEWGNDCPYDFKNIMFKRFLYPDGGGIADEEHGGFEYYCYTFSWEESNGDIIDASIFGNNGHLLNDESKINGVYGNIMMGVYISDDNPKSIKQYLNNNVFFSTFGKDIDGYYGCYSNTFGNGCNSNTFGSNCHFNTFGNNCRNNTFGCSCFSNTLGDECYNNTFGDGCYSNKFGIRCQSNTFYIECFFNTFGDSCCTNKFGDHCCRNTFGDHCFSNIFGDHCCSNTFGDLCESNIFGHYCRDNKLDNKCEGNILKGANRNNGGTYVGGCIGNTFGLDCRHNILDNECKYNEFGDSCGCSYSDCPCHTVEYDYEGNMTVTINEECEGNVFGIACVANTFGNYCLSNTFGSDCVSNTFGDDCVSNTFGNECYDNRFGNMCELNKFGEACGFNIFCNQCQSNTFGDSCGSNKFADSCINNKLGLGCLANTFGDHCFSNIFGENCKFNTFGSNCISNTFGYTSNSPLSYYRYIIFDSGNRNINLYSTQTRSSLQYYQNVRIGMGVNNSTTYKTIADNSPTGQTYETLYIPSNSQTKLV